MSASLRVFYHEFNLFEALTCRFKTANGCNRYGLGTYQQMRMCDHNSATPHSLPETCSACASDKDVPFPRIVVGSMMKSSVVMVHWMEHVTSTLQRMECCYNPEGAVSLILVDDNKSNVSFVRAVDI